MIFNQLLTSFKALSDETRLRLVHVLGKYELNVNELTTLLGMGQSRVSRHLKILAEAGLVAARRDGLWVFYSQSAGTEAAELWKRLGERVNSEEEPFAGDLRLARKILDERDVDTRHLFNNLAEDWDRINREIMGDFDLTAALLALMTPCDTAVDLGCGMGVVLAGLKSKAAHLIGVDGSPRMLELARRRFSGNEAVSLRIGELDHLPLADGEAQFACLNMVLHHLSHPDEALREIHRILTPGAYLVVTDFDKHEMEAMRTEYGDRWLGFSSDEIKTILNRAGFEAETPSRVPVRKGLYVLLTRALRK